jgi:hypothetical protein
VIVTPKWLGVVASVCKLAALATGTAYAARSARALDPGSAIRSAWLLMSAWFACFLAGQITLTSYELARGSAPIPSIGDLFFVVGYAAVTLATIRVIVSYRGSGFPMGRARDHLLIAAVVAAIFAFVGVSLLAPVASSATPLLTRIVNVGYPVLDFILLVPTLVLLRMTLAFRGGRVWTVWGTLLVGIVLFTAGDVIFAIPAPEATFASPLSDLCFLLGYGAAAAGAALEYRLLSE